MNYIALDDEKGVERHYALVKTGKFLTEKFEVEDYNDYIDIDGSPIFNYGRFIEDFKKYMKGE